MISAQDMKRGSDLHPNDQRHVLDAWLYRMTHESVRRWPQTERFMREHGWRLSLISDAEWLASSSFKVTRKGRLDRRAAFCNHDSSCRDVCGL